MINYLIDSYCYPTKLVVWGETDEYGLVFLVFCLAFWCQLALSAQSCEPVRTVRLFLLCWLLLAGSFNPDWASVS